MQRDETVILVSSILFVVSFIFFIYGRGLSDVSVISNPEGLGSSVRVSFP